jgi:hypothetical protein
VKDKNGDVLADSRNILNRWKNYFSQIFNVHNVINVRQIEVHTVVPLATVLSRLKLPLQSRKTIN